MGAEDWEKNEILDLIKVLTEILVFVLVMIALLLCRYIFDDFLITKLRFGFYCTDLSINGRISDCIPYYTTYIVGLVLVFIMIIVLELINKEQDKNVPFIKCEVPSWVYNIFYCLFVYTFGYICILCLSCFIKRAVFRLRPNFRDVCEPSINCTLEENQNKFHRQFFCKNPKFKFPASVRHWDYPSFPAEIVMIYFYAIIFLCIYMQFRMKGTTVQFLRLGFQFFGILGAIFVACAAISDNQHYPSDVLAGVIFGSCGGIIFAFATKSFLYKEEVEEED